MKSQDMGHTLKMMGTKLKQSMKIQKYCVFLSKNLTDVCNELLRLFRNSAEARLKFTMMRIIHDFKFHITLSKIFFRPSTSLPTFES